MIKHDDPVIDATWLTFKRIGAEGAKFSLPVASYRSITAAKRMPDAAVQLLDPLSRARVLVLRKV